MSVRTVRGTWVAVAGALLVGATSLAQDAPPGPTASKASRPPAQPDPLEAEVEGIRRLVAGEMWKPAKSAIDEFLRAHANNRNVLAHLAGIESDLQKCLFRLSGPKLTPVQLLGRGATKYDPASGRAEFRVTATTDEAGWRSAGDVRFFDALFDGEVSVEMDAEAAASTTVLLGFDSETRGAYAFVPGIGDWGRQAFAYRIDPGADEPVKLGDGGLLQGKRYVESVRYGMSASRVVIEVRKSKVLAKRDRTDVQSFADGRYRRGFVAIRGPARLGDEGLLIEGRLDPMFAKRQVAEADARRFRQWRTDHWKRESALPDWVIRLERAAGAWAEELPGDCPGAAGPALVALQRAAFEARRTVSSLPRAEGLSGASSDWQEALLAFGDGRHADAESAARRVIAADPGFAPAHALTGRAMVVRGADEDAVALFAAALGLDPAFAPAFDGLALVAFRAGDTDAMAAHLSAAAAAGVSSGFTTELRQVLLRVRRGPDWKRRFETLTPNFRVTSDASLAVCNEVAKTLEECVDVYGQRFRRRTRKARAQVRVFSGFGSYADYVSDFGVDPQDTLGVYLPTLRELCVHLHEDRPELWNTLRHEAFHQFVHQFLDDVPIWFDEGYAEYFGFSRRKLGKGIVGQVADEQAELAQRAAPKFTPLERLFLLEPGEFMADAGVHYVQSWALIHLLRETKDPALKGILDRYFDALLAGRSPREAYDEVLAPSVGAMETALRAHVAALRAR